MPNTRDHFRSCRSLYDACINNDYIWSLANKKCFSTGSNSPLLLGGDGQGNDYVFFAGDDEVVRIAFEEVSSVKLTKYVGLVIHEDEAKRSLPVLVANLPKDTLVRMRVEHQQSGRLYRGLEVALNDDYALSVKS